MAVEMIDRVAGGASAARRRAFRPRSMPCSGNCLADSGDGRDRLYAAMRHAAIGGGKRLRPLLTVAASRLFGIAEDRAIRVGAAIEAIHVYSLIHDDLPCMDDDDLRRGKPTVHKAFGEAIAVLAGDSLHAMAFEILADPKTHEDPFVRSDLVLELARASGPAGMAGGQMMDLAAESAGARPRRDHPAPATEDRRADRIRGRGGGDHGAHPARSAHAAARLCPQCRARLPDRRRSDRPCGRRSRGRQARRQGRRRRQGDLRRRCSARSARASRRHCWSSRRSSISPIMATRPTCCAPSRASRSNGIIDHGPSPQRASGSIRARSTRSRSGHLDIIRRGAHLVDRLVIGVTTNPSKEPMFSVAERLEMVRREIAGHSGRYRRRRVRLAADGLRRAQGAAMILRGLRAVADFEYEYQMAGMNQQLNDESKPSS